MAQEGAGETLLDILRRRAMETPDNLAFRELRNDLSARDEVSYSALLARAIDLGERLRTMAPAGGRVLVLTPGFIDYLTAMFGCFVAGLTAVSGAPPHPPSARPGRHQARVERLASVLRTAGAHAVVGARDLLDRFAQIAPMDLANLALAPIEDVTGAMGATRTSLPGGPGLEDIAYLQFTSGSTRAPGGVVIRHRNAASNAMAQAQALQAGPDDLGVSWLPLYHDYGLVGAAFTPLAAGFPCIFMPAAGVLERPQRWLECISQSRATISWAPDFAYRLCAEAVESDHRFDLSHWRVAVNAAEPVRAETLRRFVRTYASSGFASSTFYPSYGLAEATLAATMPTPGEDLHVLRLDRRALSAGKVLLAGGEAEPREVAELVGCGRPVEGIELAIVDPASGHPRAPDRVGEIWLRGDSISEGLFNLEAGRGLGSDGVVSGRGAGWMRTGDMGFVRDDILFIAGRAKDIVIVRGENLYPQDLEFTAMEAHGALRADGACAVGAARADGSEGVQIICEIERRRGAEAPQAAIAIRQALLERHDVEPLAVILIEAGSLPKTSSGKVQRKACRDALSTGTLAVIHVDELSAPVTGPRPTGAAAVLEWTLLRLQPLTGSHPLREATVLADLGLTSLQITELAAEIERTFGRRIAVAELFELRTLGDVVVRLVAITG